MESCAGPGQNSDHPSSVARAPARSSRPRLPLCLLQRANRKTDLVQVLGLDHGPEYDRCEAERLPESVHMGGHHCTANSGRRAGAGPAQARAWLPGVAVSVTVAPTLKLAEQPDPQSMPKGLLVTVPPAEPREVTVNVTEIGVNVAVTVVAALTVTVQVPVPLHPPPLHPANADPAAAVAVSDTVVPRS